jgi:serine/threonine-protein kinase
VSESIERLLEGALAMEPERRRHFVEDACGGDPQLRDELMSLIAQADAAEGFFALLTDAVFASSPPGESERNPPQPEDEELRAGDMIGHYRIVARIASGGMGNVYRARDTRLDRDVALKFGPPSPGASPGAEERLLMEARAAAALAHPNVCSIYQVGETDGGRLFIAMACYDGETLKERLRRAPMSVEESVATALQIARGLAAAHARGIIHRDVKPGNVMLGSDGTVRLLDFGLAVAMNTTITRPGATPGTVAYMSPEQVRGGALDARTDLWSLGVVLYEMLVGVRPNRGASAPELVYTILREEPIPIGKRLPDLDARLARVVDTLLQKDPTARYQGAAEVIADLEDLLAEAHYTHGRVR